MKNKGYAKFVGGGGGGANKVHYGRCRSGVIRHGSPKLRSEGRHVFICYR